MALSEPTDVLTTDYLTAALWNTQKSLLFDAIGSQEFTEQNYVTNDEPVTTSLDALDQQVKDNTDNIATVDTWVDDLMVGYIRGLEVSYNAAQIATISGGVIHVYDGTTHHVLKCAAQLSKDITGHGQTSVPIYFYVDAPASGTTLVAADIEWNATAPTYDHAKKGWYHPTTTDWRFIGSIPVDGSGNLIKGYRGESGNSYIIDNTQVLVSGGTAATWTDIANIETYVPNIDNVLAILLMSILADAGGTRTMYTRKNGSAAATGYYAMAAPASSRVTIVARLSTDSTGKIEYQLSNAAAQAMIYIMGYWEPR